MDTQQKLMDTDQVRRAVTRIAHEILERNKGIEHICLVGIRTRDLAVKRGEAFELLGRDPAALPRGCSRAADEWLR